jgi:hypothetical protein
MGMVRTASIVALLMAGTAVAQTTVQLELEIGGDNHAADLKVNNFVLYTPGSTADGQQIDINTTPILNYGVRAIVSGDHDGYQAKGVANLVMDLELRVGIDDTGPIAGAEFFSSYHDAAGSCADFTPPVDQVALIGHCGRDATGKVNSQENVCVPCYAAAAFAFVFDINSTYGPARLIDQNVGNWCGTDYNPWGGPNMGVFLYPTCELGKLYGVGAGYPHYQSSGTTTRTRPYVGLYPNPDAQMPQSPVALIEGQIDLSGLPLGFYTLVAIPGNGINILRGDIDLGTNQPAFALPADNKVGDTLTFELIDVPVQDPELVAAASRCNHGGTDFDIPLNLSGTPTTEPRIGPQKVVLTFSEEMAAQDGSIDAGQEITASIGTITQIDVVGNEIIVSLADLPQWGCLIIEATGLKSASSGAPQTGDTDVYIDILTGDVDFSGGVNIVDLSSVKGLIVNPGPLDATNFQLDVDCSGGVNVVDLSAVKANLGHDKASLCGTDID